MKLIPYLLCLGCLSVTTTYGRTLAEAASIKAAELPAGCIVTGEYRAGKTEYALAGKAEPADAKAETLLFEMGSITKTFTGLLLAQAVVEKKVKLESTLAEVLGPDFKFADARVAAITLVQLSTHTSGLPRLPWNMNLLFSGPDPYAKYEEKQMFDFLSQVKLEASESFPVSYSNYGVALLGTMLGRVYGQSWESLILEKICQPLGLTETRQDISASKLPLAPPHQGERPGHTWHFDCMAPAGGLCTTVSDLMKYGLAVLHPEKTPLSAAFAIALQPHAETGKGKIGLGWFINSRGDLHWFIHNGATGGYVSVLEVVPQRDVIHIVLINNSSMKPESVLAARTESSGK